MQSIRDFLVNESNSKNGYVVCYSESRDDEFDALLIETDYNLDKMANIIYKDNSNGNLAKSYFKSLLNGGLSSSAPSRNLYSDGFTKYLKDNGITNDYIVSIMTLKSYLQYFKKMPKSGTEFTL